MNTRIKKAVATFAIATALTLNVFAKQNVKHEGVLRTTGYKCKIFQPVKVDNKTRVDSIQNFYLYLNGRVLLDGFNFLENMKDIVYVHDFGNNIYAVVLPDRIWGIKIISDTHYDTPEQSTKLYVKRIVQSKANYCGPKTSPGYEDHKLEKVYAIKDAIFVQSDKGMVWTVRLNSNDLECQRLVRILSEDESLCYYRDDNGIIQLWRLPNPQTPRDDE